MDWNTGVGFALVVTGIVLGITVVVAIIGALIDRVAAGQEGGR